MVHQCLVKRLDCHGHSKDLNCTECFVSSIFSASLISLHPPVDALLQLARPSADRGGVCVCVQLSLACGSKIVLKCGGFTVP